MELCYLIYNKTLNIPLAVQPVEYGFLTYGFAFPGFFLGELGMSCAGACSGKNLSCHWYDTPTPNSYIAEFQALNIPCLSPDTVGRIWQNNSHPAYYTDSDNCVGFTDVQTSSCSAQIPGAKRLCRCIYPGMSTGLHKKFAEEFSICYSNKEPFYCNPLLS